jgi:hypothetical protein
MTDSLPLVATVRGLAAVLLEGAEVEVEFFGEFADAAEEGLADAAEGVEAAGEEVGDVVDAEAVGDALVVCVGVAGFGVGEDAGGWEDLESVGEVSDALAFGGEDGEAAFGVGPIEAEFAVDGVGGFDGEEVDDDVFGGVVDDLEVLEEGLVDVGGADEDEHVSRGVAFEVAFVFVGDEGVEFGDGEVLWFDDDDDFLVAGGGGDGGLRLGLGGCGDDGGGGRGCCLCEGSVGEEA